MFECKKDKPFFLEIHKFYNVHQSNQTVLQSKQISAIQKIKGRQNVRVGSGSVIRILTRGSGPEINIYGFAICAVYSVTFLNQRDSKSRTGQVFFLLSIGLLCTESTQISSAVHTYTLHSHTPRPNLSSSQLIHSRIKIILFVYQHLPQDLTPTMG